MFFFFFTKNPSKLTGTSNTFYRRHHEEYPGRRNKSCREGRIKKKI